MGYSLMHPQRSQGEKRRSELMFMLVMMILIWAWINSREAEGWPYRPVSLYHSTQGRIADVIQGLKIKIKRGESHSTVGCQRVGCREYKRSRNSSTLYSVLPTRMCNVSQPQIRDGEQWNEKEKWDIHRAIATMGNLMVRCEIARATTGQES